jgi:hypothetical protein
MSLHGTRKDRPDCGGHDVLRVKDEHCGSYAELNNSGGQSAKWQKPHSMCQLLSKAVHQPLFGVRTRYPICLARSSPFGHSRPRSTRCLVSRTEGEANYARVRDEAAKGFFVRIRKD